VCADGTFMTLSYEEGGECTRLSYAKFVKSEDENKDLAMHGGPSSVSEGYNGPLIGTATANRPDSQLPASSSDV
jgi:hypothetical protein